MSAAPIIPNLVPADAGLPVVERIRLDLMTALQAMSPATGAHETYTVEAAARRGNAVAHRKIIVRQIQPTPAPEQSINLKAWQQPFHVEVPIVTDEADGTAVDAYINGAIADVTRAVMADVTRGGLAIDTMPPEPEFIPNANGETQWVVLPVLVHYRTQYNDPNVPA